MNLTHWISTGTIALFFAFSTYTYFFSSATIEGLKDLGFPHFFIVQLGIMQGIALVFLLLQNIPLAIKEWTYAGMFFFLITGLVAHIAHKDYIFITLFLIFLMIVLGVSYWSMPRSV